MEKFVKDLIELPEVKTVIQLSDLERPDLRQKLSESFILTEEVSLALTSCLEAIVSGRGKGIFLQGNFGAGKSHFLTVLSLLLSEDWAWQPVCQSNHRFQPFHRDLAGGQYLVLNISLVEYRSWQRLEDIILAELLNQFRHFPDFTEGLWDFETNIEPIVSGIKQNFYDQLQAFCQNLNIADPDIIFQHDHLYLLDRFIQQQSLPYKLPFNRKEIIKSLKRLFESGKKRGLVILIDELSEYLKSKSSGQAFNEDIRFLQFLGESSLEIPLWIMATLQEWIEETGTIAQDSFRKIKDRYPVRLKLSGKHVEQIVSQRLVKKKEDALTYLPRLYGQLRAALSNFPYSQEEFIGFYPVHPATIRLLEEVRSLFAEHRGVVDFIHSRLKGDPIRRIASFLENKADTLLTPDCIFDHFRVRIEDNFELSPYSQKVFRYFEREVENIFSQPEDRVLALRLLKLLILQAISGAPKKFNTEQLAEMLFFKISDLDYAINYEYLQDVLEKMYKGGAYLSVERSKEPFKDCYFVNLKDDIGLVVRRKADFISQNIFPEDLRLVTHLLPYLDETLLPLSLIEFGAKSRRSVSWQRTLREGYLMLAPFTVLNEPFIREFAREFNQSDIDFFFFIGLPLGTEERDFFQNEVLPALRSANFPPMVFWLPSLFQQESLNTLKQALSHLLLLEQLRSEESEAARRSTEHLKGLIPEDKNRVKEIYRRAYYHGEVISGQGEVLLSPAERGYMAFTQFMGEVAGKLLDKQYPKHMKVAPATEVLTSAQLQEAIQAFYQNPALSFDSSTPLGVRTTLEGFLKPMDLLKKSGSGYVLSADPSKNDLARLFMERMGSSSPVAVDEIYRSLRKGPYGLSRHSFNMLLLSILFSGLATPYDNRGKSLPLRQITANQLAAINKVGIGEVLDPQTRQFLADFFLLPKKLRQAEISLQRQDEIWQYLTEWKRELSQELEVLARMIKDYKSYQNLSNLPWETIDETIGRLEETMEQIKVSYASLEGITSFMGFCRQNPYLEDHFKRYERIKTFFRQEADQYLFLADYISSLLLVVPSGIKYEQIQEAKEAVERFLRDREAFWREDFARTEAHLFQQFSERYVNLYTQEHQREKSPDRLSIYEDFRNGKPFRLLTLLSKVESISVANSVLKINRNLADLNHATCGLDCRVLLRQKPVCSCGFQLGQTLELTHLGHLQDIAVKGLKEYVAILKEDRYREKILVFSGGLQEIGKGDLARNLKKLLSLEAGEEERDFIPNLESLINRELIDAINEALAGKRSYVTRDLDELYENLIDRHFPKDQFLKIIHDWLSHGERLEEDTLIKIVTGKKSPAEEEEKNLLGQYYPSLLPLFLKAGQEDFHLLTWALHWLKMHNIESGQAGRISGLPEAMWVHLTGDLQGWTEFLMKEKRELARKQIDEIERKVETEGLKDRFLSSLNLSNQISEALEVIRREKLFHFSLHEAYEHVFKILDHYPERRTKKELRQFTDEPAVREETASYHGALKRFIALESGLNHLEKRENLTAFEIKDWEELYCQYLSGLELDLDLLKEEQKSAGLSDDGRWRGLKGRVEEINRKVEASFSVFYQNLMNLDLMGKAKGPATLLDLVKGGSLSSQAKKLKGDHYYYLLMDGMRWDVWSVLKREFFGVLSVDLRIVKETAIWAFHPTTTQVQLDHLKESMERLEKKEKLRSELEKREPFRSDMVNAKTPALGENSEALQFKEFELVKFNFIDTKIHSSKDSLDMMTREVLLQSRLILQPYLESLPRNSVLILFADHGFKSNPKWEPRAKYDQPRYLHGGISPQEVIVPLTLLHKP